MKNYNNHKLGVVSFLILCLILSNLAFSQTEKLNAIKAAIEAKGAQWTPGESWVTRLSPEEFLKLLGARDEERGIVEPISLLMNLVQIPAINGKSVL